MLKNTLLIDLLSTFCLAGAIPSVEVLSLDEKIGQLLVIATTSDPDQNKDFMKQSPYQLEPEYTKKLIEKYHIGGVIFLGASTPKKQVALTNKLQECSNIPLLITLDAEWGLSMRHTKDVITYPKAMTLGALSPNDNNLIYQAGQEIGRQCKAIGVHYITSPVADVNSNPDNPIINVRSFGENSKKVAQKASLFMLGLKEYVLTTAKHFPGHGDTDLDSHNTLPTISHTKERLDNAELAPFKKLINDGVDGILTAHLAVPALAEQENMPATFSHNIVTKLLRQELKFNGLIITDGMGMKGVTEGLEPGEPELKALMAGHDIILCPVDVPRAIARIKQALQNGTLTEDQINTSVERILTAKQKANIHHPIKYDKSQLQLPCAKELQKQLYQAVITLARNENECLPLKKNSAETVHIITNDQNSRPPFIQELEKYLTIKHHHIDPNTSQESCDQLEEQLKKHKNVIAALHIPGRSGMIETQHTEQQKPTHSPYISLINKLEKKLILVLFGNPYNLKHIPDTKATIVAYENEDEAQIAAAQTIVAKHNPRGQLPVTASNEYPEGLGLSY